MRSQSKKLAGTVNQQSIRSFNHLLKSFDHSADHTWATLLPACDAMKDQAVNHTKQINRCQCPESKSQSSPLNIGWLVEVTSVKVWVQHKEDLFSVSGSVNAYEFLLSDI